MHKFTELMQLKRMGIMATGAAYSNPDFNKSLCTKGVLQDQCPYVVIHVGIFAMIVERSTINKATNQVHVLGFLCGAVFRKDEMTEG